MKRVSAVAALALALALAGLASPAWSEDPLEVNLKVVGRSDLGGGGPWDDLAVVGTTAVVSAPGTACGPSSVTVVDVKDARHPKVVATVPMPEGTTVVGLDAEAVATPAFTGDLLVVAFGGCRAGGAAAGGGLLLYDLVDPSKPRQVGRVDKTGLGQSVSVAGRDDGRVVAATYLAGSGTAVELDEVTDPARPHALGRWAPPARSVATSCPMAGGHVALSEGGVRAVVALGDGTVYDLDVAQPAGPVVLGHADARPGQGRPVSAASLPVGKRSLAVVSEENGPGPAPACAAGQEGRGLRLLTVDPPAPLADATEVRLPSPASPGRLVASGELAFVAWHSDGLRIVDLGQIVPRTVAQFAPPAGDVVGVGLLADHIVVTDRTSGLYVLDRPDEGHQESFWSQFRRAFLFIGAGMLMGAFLVVPRLAMAFATFRSRVRGMSPVRVRRGVDSSRSRSSRR